MDMNKVNDNQSLFALSLFILVGKEEDDLAPFSLASKQAYALTTCIIDTFIVHGLPFN